MKNIKKISLIALLLISSQAFAVQQCNVTNLPDVDNCANPVPAIGTPLVLDDLSGLANVTYVQDKGAFRVQCKPAWYGQYDPIVRPEEPGMIHSHTGYGNTAITAYSDMRNLRSNGGNSTCGTGTTNLSTYYHPSFINTKINKVMEPFQFFVYYKAAPNIDTRKTVAIPEGLVMIAGNSKKKVEWDAQDNAWDDIYRYTCNQGGRYKSIPACGQNQLLGFMLNFPMCIKQDNAWITVKNPLGMVLDSLDHKSHTAYLRYVGGSPYVFACPTSHPLLIPYISYVAYYRMTEPEGSAIVAIASDMFNRKGWTIHGDFGAAWIQSAAQAIAEIQWRQVDAGTFSYNGS